MDMSADEPVVSDSSTSDWLHRLQDSWYKMREVRLQSREYQTSFNNPKTHSTSTLATHLSISLRKSLHIYTEIVMNCHKEPEFQIRDIPNLRGYIAIVTGGKSPTSHLQNWSLTAQATLVSAMKQHFNSPSRALESTSPAAQAIASTRPSPI